MKQLSGRSGQSGQSGGGPKADSAPRRSILVVDDSRLQRRILGSSILKWGYDLHEAASGEEALGICRTRHIDLILSDWMMPGMDGPEFCRAFRALKRDTYGYFILLTSKSAKEEVAHGLDAGADDFLTKPVHPDELRARIIAGERIQVMERELQDKNRIVSSTLARLQILYDRIDRDLVEARRLQQSLVRERVRDFGGARVTLMLRPSGHVGGDLVGMFPINDRQIGVYGIDVSGHGIASALMTARLAGYFPPGAPDQNIALRPGPDGGWKPRAPAGVAAALNALILDEMETEHYLTLLLGHLDMESGRMVMTQAGHTHPVIQRRDGGLESVGAGGMPVGLISGAVYEDFEVTLGPGDRLLIPSDGITECTDARGRMLEDEGLFAILRAHAGAGGEELTDALVRDLTGFAGRDDLEDDISAVLVERAG